MALFDPGPAWLFCPADRPERFGKAAAVADVVILDLEDGVAAADRDDARTALVTTPLHPDRTGPSCGSTPPRVRITSWT